MKLIKQKGSGALVILRTQAQRLTKQAFCNGFNPIEGMKTKEMSAINHHEMELTDEREKSLQMLHGFRAGAKFALDTFWNKLNG